MAYWKRKGKRTKSLKTKTRGTTTKRKVGHKNYTDNGYKKVFGKKPRRKVGVRNTTDGAQRVGGKVRKRYPSLRLPGMKRRAN